VIFWLDARCLKLKHGFADAKSARSKAVSPRLLSQADGRDGIQQFCWRKACKVKICFARFASQTLLASNFCLARQKSPKPRLKDAVIPQELHGDRLNGDFEYVFVNTRSHFGEDFDKQLKQSAF